MATSRIAEVLQKHEKEILEEWLRELASTTTRQPQLMKAGELREHAAEFLSLLRGVMQQENMDIATAHWSGMRELLANISRSRAQQGFTPSETAMFVFSIKKPLFTRLSRTTSEALALAGDIWQMTEVLDKLGLYTMEVHQKAREEIIARQQQEMLELSTPVVKLWDGILALPLIGTLDSARTQIVMESLLQRIVESGATLAIIDITGVPTVDTLVAQHLLKAVTAARLMGAECIISGIRPQIAQTIVHLGVALGDVTTKASLADAFKVALHRAGLTLQAQSHAERKG